ncbi:hypothetical protein D3C81_1887390 [compost metagenome]
MPTSFEVLVGTAGQQVHTCQGSHVRDACQQTNVLEVFHTKAANQCRHPVGHCVRATVKAEKHQSCQVNARVTQYLSQAGIGCICWSPLGQCHGQQLLLGSVEPACICRLVDQPEPAQHSEQDGRHAFKDKQYLPIAKP